MTFPPNSYMLFASSTPMTLPYTLSHPAPAATYTSKPHSSPSASGRLAGKSSSPPTNLNIYASTIKNTSYNAPNSNSHLSSYSEPPNTNTLVYFFRKMPNGTNNLNHYALDSLNPYLPYSASLPPTLHPPQPSSSNL
jgi:hypothetical protein